MKNVTKFFAFTIATVLSAGPLFANTTEVKAAVNHLTVIETEIEQPVEDVFFTTAESARYTKLNTQGVEPDSAEVEEEPVNDVHFSSADEQHYQNQKFELLLNQLTPIMEEQEEALENLSLTEIKE